MGRPPGVAEPAGRGRKFMPQWELEQVRREIGVGVDDSDATGADVARGQYKPIDPELQAKIEALHADGYGYKRIGKELGISQWLARRALNPAYWRPK